jgi:hypothetical protein
MKVWIVEAHFIVKAATRSEAWQKAQSMLDKKNLIGNVVSVPREPSAEIEQLSILDEPEEGVNDAGSEV